MEPIRLSDDLVLTFGEGTIVPGDVYTYHRGPDSLSYSVALDHGYDATRGVRYPGKGNRKARRAAAAQRRHEGAPRGMVVAQWTYGAKDEEPHVAPPLPSNAAQTSAR